MEVNNFSPVSVISSSVEESTDLMISSERTSENLDPSNVESSTQSSLIDPIVSAIARRALFAQQRSKTIGNQEKKLFYGVVNSQSIPWVQKKIINWSSLDKELLEKLGGARSEYAPLINQNYTINLLLLKALNDIENDRDTIRTTSFHVITSDEPVVQAAALFKTNESRIEEGVSKPLPLYISYLSSAPWNLRIPANARNKLKVEGAASALIESAIYKSMEIGTRGAVALESVPLAEKFYEGFGFERRNWEASENDLIPMELSEEKAAEFLASRRAGRALPLV